MFLPSPPLLSQRHRSHNLDASIALFVGAQREGSIGGLKVEVEGGGGDGRERESREIFLENKNFEDQLDIDVVRKRKKRPCRIILTPLTSHWCLIPIRYETL